VLQRVKYASVSVGGERISEIGPGLLLLVGVAKDDGEPTADWLAEKVAGLRVFADADGKMNLDIRETGGEILAVSQLPREAELLYDYFCKKLHAAGVRSVETGSFGAMMDVKLLNYGPITIVLER
jgi:D-tyrosyl-tRNA(Tyr) deacylase